MSGNKHLWKLQRETTRKFVTAQGSIDVPSFEAKTVDGHVLLFTGTEDQAREWALNHPGWKVTYA